MTRYLIQLRLSVVAAILIAATAGGVFSQTSTVPSTRVLEPAIKLVTEVSIGAARRIKFVPATLNGKPVSMFMQLEYNFSLY